MPTEHTGQIVDVVIKVHSAPDHGLLESPRDTGRNPLSLQHRPLGL